MNNKHILDLTLRLSQALDQNYDVVSMETVLLVISALERTTITKEQLESTRLAKYINQLRRRTKCENLARRAKSLLKRWREMVGIQQSNELSVETSLLVNAPVSTAITSGSTLYASSSMPVTDNAVSTFLLTNPQISHQRQQQQQNSSKQQTGEGPYHSQPSSPTNPRVNSTQNKFLLSISNPATTPQVQKNANANARKRRKLEKEVISESIVQQHQQQPTSFANLITGLGSTFSTSEKTICNKTESSASSEKLVETFIIEHSSNSNSDLICIPSNNTSAIDVPPVIIDLQDTNSSMNSLVSKEMTNASSYYRNKIFAKKTKKEKKRKDRVVTSRKNQPLQDCDDQNTTTAPYQNKPPSDLLLLDEKSHSACPTISNISEILSLSNSSMSSVFPSVDAMSKNIFQSVGNESVSSTSKMSKSDLTFAGKFKQNTSSTSTCNVLNYNSDSTNANILKNNSSNQNKFSMFGGIGTNSNDSSSSSRTTPFHIAVNTVKRDTSNSRHNVDDGIIKRDINEKSLSNLSNKCNSSTENAFSIGVSNVIRKKQQSVDLIITDLPQQAVKQPKKRGRKKGSKGVDSVIAKETSLSSQMLISSLTAAGKKVKTTKELYAEMENRKLVNVKVAGSGEVLGNSSANCAGQLQQLEPFGTRRPSYCSDIADSDSGTITSEPSRDSGNIVRKTTIGKREKPLDNNSNFSKHDSELKTDGLGSNESSKPLTDENSVLETTSKIKLQIQEILKILPPPASVKKIEFECVNSITPCTCTIEEITVTDDNKNNENIGDNHKSKDSNLNAITITNQIRGKDNTKLLSTIEQTENATDNVNVDSDLKDTLPQQPLPPKLKKSIFDLDFEDDEDPLNSLIADIVGKSFKPESELVTIGSPVIDDKSELPLSSHVNFAKVEYDNAPYALNVLTPFPKNIVLPSYAVKYDPDCEAKDFFEIQTQRITKFHINTLHNCFVPNVNGNWNHADDVSIHSCINDKDYIHKSDLIVDGYDVVPLYGWDMNKKIVKDLSHVKFTKKFKVKHSNCQNQTEILFHIPFLGVSRIPDVDGVKYSMRVIKAVALDEEKENVDNNLNVNNNILNAIVLDTNDAKETEELVRDSFKNVGTSSDTMQKKLYKKSKKSSLKYTKKQATLVKKSTIKRLKLSVNRNFEANSSDSYDINYDQDLKVHRNLFHHEELFTMTQDGSGIFKDWIFPMSSCSSNCSSTDVETNNEGRKRTTSISSSLSSSSYNVLSLQHQIIQADIVRRTIVNTDKSESDLSDYENDKNINRKSANDNNNDGGANGDQLPAENNHMLLSFNNIYNKSTRYDNAEQQNKDHENLLKRQLQNCDDYNNLNNNFNLIKYIDNTTSSINNNNNTYSNNYSGNNINISSSNCTNENVTNSATNYLQHHTKNDSDNVQIKPFREYQTGIRAVDEDVNDDDGNNCGRLQQFKEWHEVLQLRSYNEELLTVLPYVILE